MIEGSGSFLQNHGMYHQRLHRANSCTRVRKERTGAVSKIRVSLGGTDNSFRHNGGLKKNRRLKLLEQADT